MVSQPYQLRKLSTEYEQATSKSSAPLFSDMKKKISKNKLSSSSKYHKDFGKPSKVKSCLKKQQVSFTIESTFNFNESNEADT